MFKLYLNVKEVVERNKAIPFVNCKVKFNQMTQSSSIPFKQSMVFRVMSTEQHKCFEVIFEKNFKEFGELSLEVKNEYLADNFELEKLFPIERLDSNIKTYAKIVISVLEYTQENKPLKYKNYVEKKSQTNSPKPVPKNSKGTPEAKHQISFKHNDQDYDSISLVKYNTSVENSNNLSSRNFSKQTFFKNPEQFKLNLQEISKDLKQEDLVKESKVPSKGQRTKENKDPLTFRESDSHTKRPHFRKTKSMEKLRVQKMQYSKKYANFFVMKDRNMALKEKINDLETVENESRDIKSSSKKEGSLDVTRKRNQDSQRYFEDLMKEANHRLLKENNKFEHLIMSIQKLRDKYETEFHTYNEQLESCSDRCRQLEKNLYLMYNELIMWKSKAELINLLEQEVDNLRGALDEQEKKNVETQSIVNKGMKDFERIIGELDIKNKQFLEDIVRLENENEDLKREISTLNQKKNEIIYENNTLKAKVVSSEINSELVKRLTTEKEVMAQEISGLRTTNKQLKEMLTTQRKTNLCNEVEAETKFIDDIEKIKGRINSINRIAISSLEDVNNYLNINYDLRNNFDLIDTQNKINESDTYIYEPESLESPRTEIKSFTTEIGKNLDRINAFIDNNKKLEKCLFSAVVQVDKKVNSRSKRKSVDIRSSSGSLNHSQCSSQVDRIKSERLYDVRKLSYTPAKGDVIDQKLSSYINNHHDSRRLSYLFKRTNPGEYLFGSRRISIKIDNTHLYVKTRQSSYQPIESFIHLNQEQDHFKLPLESFKRKASDFK